VRHVDLVIIGSGSGNSLPDERFAGLEVAVVEEGVFGGTCLNVGCYPDEDVRLHRRPGQGTRRYRPLRRGRGAGEGPLDRHQGPRFRPDRPDLRRAARRYRAEGFAEHHLYPGTPSSPVRKQISITYPDGRVDELSADRFVLAAGSRPSIPEVISKAGIPYHTSTPFMRIDEFAPAADSSWVAVSSAEFAHVFSALGTGGHHRDRARSCCATSTRRSPTGSHNLARQSWDVRTNAPPVHCAEADPGLQLEFSTAAA